MGEIDGFLKVKRQEFNYRPVKERVKDYKEVFPLPDEEIIKLQASRCMECGTPFCNWGCPLGNYIPEWNDKVYRGLWKEAFLLLDETNCLPEITGRVCPAPCEYSCVLGINDDPVTIRYNELTIIEKAFKEGYIKPKKIKNRIDKKIAVVGSGPAGLSCAVNLNYKGYYVTVFEKDKEVGGILRYGIPDFKLEKHIIERRVNIWKKEGIEFITGKEVGKDISVKDILKDYDAVCLAIGCRVPRDLKVEGRELKGIHFAMDYLIQSNKKVQGLNISEEEIIDARDKEVVVIGGGDTGADCIGTALRQGAKKVIQLEILPRPPERRPLDTPWPRYPFILRTSSSHEEGNVERKWQVSTKKFMGDNGKIKKLLCVEVRLKKEKNKMIFEEIKGSEFEINADLVILAMGFTNPEKKIIDELNLATDERGNIKTDCFGHTSYKGIFAAGDVHRGPSLIVWAINEGRITADGIDKFLKSKE